MEAVQTFFLMGGYGVFVWPAYALTVVVMIWLVVATWTRLRTVERALEAFQAGSASQQSPARPPSEEIGAAEAQGTTS